MMSPMIPLSKFFVPQAGEFDDVLKIKQKEKFIYKSYCKITKLEITNSGSVDPWERAQQVVSGMILSSRPPSRDLELCTVQRSRLEGRDDNHTIFLTPESCISCPLNREPALCSFIQSGMQPGQTLLLASQYQDEANLLYQAVYLITSDNTSPIYLKQHAIPCIERIPRYFKKNAWLRTIFRSENDFSCAQEQVISNGFLLNGMWVIPRLCSDFFLVTSVADLDKLRLSHDEPLVVVLLVNDTWFAPYMRSLLYQVARMRAWLAQVELVYVGYASDSSRLVRRKDFL